MSVEGTSSAGSDLDHGYYRDLEARKILRKTFDVWILNHPLIFRDHFDKVERSMLHHAEFARLAVKNIMEKNEMLTDSPENEFTHIVNLLCRTDIARGEGPEEKKNVLDFLAEIFAVRYPQEAGSFRDCVKNRLEVMLGPAMMFANIMFQPSIFRSTFWKLVETLELNKKGPGEKKNRAILMFSAAIASVLVAYGHENDFTIGSNIGKYDKAEKVPDYLVMMIESEFFKILSVYFIMGFWSLVKYREGGEYVTDFFFRTSPEDNASEAAKLSQLFNINFNEDNSPGQMVLQEWEKLTAQMESSKMIRSPEGSKITKQVGRPRKYTRKSLDSGHAADTDDHQFKVPKTASPRKKYTRKSSTPQAPPPSAPALPAVPPKVVKPKIDIPNPEDVGLAKPIFIRQMEFAKTLREEMARRRDPNSAVPPMDLKKLFDSVYMECHKIERLTREAGPIKLTPQQKLVQKNWKEIYRFPHGRPEPEAASSEESNEELPRAKHAIPDKVKVSSSKQSRKFKQPHDQHRS